MQDRYRMRATDFYPGFSFARVLSDLRFAIQDGCRMHATKNGECREPILHFMLCIAGISAPLCASLTAESGCITNRENRLFSRRFSRGCSSKQFRVPALWAEQIPLSLRARTFPHSYASLRNAGPTTTPTRAKAKKRTCRGPRLERALALRSVGIAKGLRVWVGTIRMGMGILVSIAALPRW